MEVYAAVDPNDLVAPIFFFAVAALLLGASLGFSLGFNAGRRAERSEAHERLATHAPISKETP